MVRRALVSAGAVLERGRTGLGLLWAWVYHEEKLCPGVLVEESCFLWPGVFICLLQLMNEMQRPMFLFCVG